MASNAHLLELDLLTLSTADDEDTWHEDAGGYGIRTLATDADFGNAEPIKTVLPSALAVGSRERITSWGNRELQFRVELRAPSAMGLNRAERTLKLAVSRARELRWTPPAGEGVLTVHDVHHAHLERIYDDLEEVGVYQMPARVFWLRITAMPFPRSAVEVVEAAVGGGTATSSPAPVVTTIYSGAATTGWTAINGSTGAAMAVAAASGGGVRNAAPFVGSLPSLRYSTSIAMGTDRWLTIRREVNSGTPVDQIQIVGTMAGFSITRTLTPVTVIGQDAFYLMPGASVTIADLRVLGRAGQTMTIRSITRQDRMPFVSNTRQLIRQIDVKGSADTEGSLSLTHATTPLGQVMIYSWPDDGSGYVPPIGQYLTSSTADAVTDTTAVLGRYLPVTTTTSTHRVFEIPCAQLPEGTYTVLVRAKAATAGGMLITATAATRLGGVDLSPQPVAKYVPLTTSYTVQAIDKLTLPPAAVPRGSAAKVKVTIGNAQPGAEMRLDEVYLCNDETGDLTLVNAGVGTVAAGQSSTRLRMDSPTVDRPQAAIWVGTAADWSDARHAAGLDSIPAVAHAYRVGPMNVLSVCNAYDAAAELRYFPRWEQNAEDLAVA